MRFLFPLIGYFCVATVISASLGYVYLRQSGQLDDERMFQVVALLHGIDLTAVGDDKDAKESDVPPEELSYDQQLVQLREATLDFDVKQKMLAVSLTDFERDLKRLNAQTTWYAQLKSASRAIWKSRNGAVADEALEKVVRHLEGMNPKKQVKPFLLKMVQDNRVDEVIDILGIMSKKVRREVLLSFDSDEDRDMLYKIYSKVLDGEPAKPVIEEQLRALQQLKGENN